MLIMKGIVSYRSVPRILTLIDEFTALSISWKPHFSSVINWTLRLGLGLLKQVTPVSWDWVAIMDYSIDVGTKKALVILRVRLDIYQQRQGAVRLQDCECIGLHVTETSTGKIIAEKLTATFEQSGRPVAILKDGGYDLQKGVRLWQDSLAQVELIDDIGHVIANALKSEYEKTDPYQNFTQLISEGSARLRQTKFAYLIPPKLRTKGRFQSISRLGDWSLVMMELFRIKGRAKEGSALQKLRQVFPKFTQLRPFLSQFSETTKIVSQIMEKVKLQGLTRQNNQECLKLLDELPDESVVKIRIIDWFEKHNKVYQKLGGIPLIVSTDIIESLFGKFKYINERSPHHDMNRSALLIPALCGKIN